MGDPGEVRIRSSLHAGPATERDGDFFGPALNRVARINGVAHPDQSNDLEHLIARGRAVPERHEGPPTVHVLQRVAARVC